MPSTPLPPERTCIACRRKAPQSSFIRLARTAEGRLVVVQQGGRIGRSAYLCLDSSCIEAAFKKDRIARALRESLGREALAELKVELECKVR